MIYHLLYSELRQEGMNCRFRICSVNFEQHFGVLKTFTLLEEKNVANPANVPQNSLIGIGVGVGISGVAIIWAIAQYLHNQTIARLNELNNVTKAKHLKLRILVTDNPMQIKVRKNSLTNSPKENGEIL